MNTKQTSIPLTLIFLLSFLFVLESNSQTTPPEQAFVDALQSLDFTAVKNDLVSLFNSSQSFWPADYGFYGPLFIRLAWHCAGSYRRSDGRGGCDGGRIRYDPEQSWPDNTNLDKAVQLLYPLKQKYGKGLSWGDLIVLAGTTAIEAMGAPVLGFCAGRVDAADGAASTLLGPSQEQAKLFPCPVNGQCPAPLGTGTVGLIYVNPGGPMGVPNPNASAPNIREVFARMSMDDVETVALIGGGHAFGKTHGACNDTDAAGVPPSDDPVHPWQGTCGAGALQGKAENTVTSGFEGPWTTTPIQWSNEYFQNLLNFNWELHVGPGGANQWQVERSSPVQPTAPTVDGSGTQEIMMLTSDIALTRDAAYLAIVQQFANNKTALEDAFAKAWYKLVTRDMGPVSRCLGGSLVPPAQPFQNPLPAPSSKTVDWPAVRSKIVELLHSSLQAFIAPDMVGSTPYNGGWFSQLAIQCASTFRSTDYQGGCNGARIRFNPERSWPQNLAMDDVLAALQSVKDTVAVDASWADLIVFAANTAIEEASSVTLSFCPGRSDALDGAGSADLEAWFFISDPIDYVKQNIQERLGLTSRETVALFGYIRSNQRETLLGYPGSWAPPADTLSNLFFNVLLNNSWSAVPASVPLVYKADNIPQNLYVNPYELVLKLDPEYKAIAQEYAGDNALFVTEFVNVWTKLMNADRFDGPVGNVCSKKVAGSSNSVETSRTSSVSSGSAPLYSFYSYLL